MECELCEFNNPKGTVTAVVIQDGKLLTLRRNEEPHKGGWDLVGGYMNQGESPEEALKREVKEELRVDVNLDFIGHFPGVAVWGGKSFAVLSHVYLAEIQGDIKLNKEENSEYKWVDLKIIDPESQSFDSNRDILRYVKERLFTDFESVKKLIHQLDSSAEVSEINFYRSLLNGYCSKKIIDGKLVGLGWIFPRRTALRKQAVIEDMIVDESQRGKGLGKEIVLDLMRWAKDNGVEVIELTSNSKRVAANGLYKKVGFELHPTNHYLYKVK